MTVMHDSPEWKGIVQDVSALRVTVDDHGRRLDTLEEKTDDTDTIIRGDGRDVPGLKADLRETKSVLKQIRFLVYFLIVIQLAENFPKLFEIISAMSK